jgi:hypothetical protein
MRESFEGFLREVAMSGHKELILYDNKGENI